MPIVLVAACALVDADGRVLMCQRPDGKQLAGQGRQRREGRRLQRLDGASGETRSEQGGDDGFLHLSSQTRLSSRLIPKATVLWPIPAADQRKSLR